MSASPAGAAVERYLEELESCLRAGVGDGAPVIVPWPEGIEAMVAGAGRDGDELVGSLAGTDIRVSDVAEQALMAGCVPEHMPVVLASVEALADPRMDTERWLASSAGMVPWLVVCGPARISLAMNSGCDAFGPGNRANASIGRAVRLVLRNLAHGTLGRATLGNGYAFSCAIPDDEESFPFTRLHTSLGFDEAASVVLTMWTADPRLVNNTCTREPEQLLLSLARTLATLSHFDPALGPASERERAVVALGYDLQEILHEAGWDRARVQQFLSENTVRRAGDARSAGMGSSPLVPRAAADQAGVRFYPEPDDIIVVRVGGPGAIGLSTVARVMAMDARGVRSAETDRPGAAVTGDEAPAASLSTDDTPEPVRTVYNYIERDFTDGWPVVPPTRAAIDELVAASDRDEDELLGTFAYAGVPVTVRDLAVNAVMAGCLPEHMPLLATAMEMVIPYGHGYISVGSWSPWLVVNGPIGRRLGFPTDAAPFGPSSGRAATAIGRALRLAIMNLGHHRPGQPYDRAVQGQGWKYTVTTFAEDELASPWEPLHTTMGFSAEDDVLTFVTGALGHYETTYSGSDPEALLRVLADDFVRHDPWGTVTRQPGAFAPRRDAFAVLSRDHIGLLARAGWDRAATQAFLYERIGASLGEIRAEGYAWEGRFPEDASDDAFIHALEGPESIMLVAAGGAGPHSMTSSMRMREMQGRVPATTTQRVT